MIGRYTLSHLPHWCLTDSFPGFYDTESATEIQQTSKLYKKMQELITAYNEFIDKVNQYITEFQTGIIKDFEGFKNCVIQTMDNFIQSINMRLDCQDKKIADAFERQDASIKDAIDYMKEHLESTVNELFETAINNGTIGATLGTTYNAQNEELTFYIAAELENE